MSQGQLIGMKSQSIQQGPLLKGVTSPRTLDFRESHWLLIAAVEGVAHNAQSVFPQMSTNLVGTACDGAGFDPGVGRTNRKNGKIRNRRLSLPLVYHRAVEGISVG